MGRMQAKGKWKKGRCVRPMRLSLIPCSVLSLCAVLLSSGCVDLFGRAQLRLAGVAVQEGERVSQVEYSYDDQGFVTAIETTAPEDLTWTSDITWNEGELTHLEFGADGSPNGFVLELTWEQGLLMRVDRAINGGGSNTRTFA